MFTVFHQFHPGLEPETPQKPPVQDTDDPKAKRIYLDAAAFGALGPCDARQFIGFGAAIR